MAIHQDLLALFQDLLLFFADGCSFGNSLASFAGARSFACVDSSITGAVFAGG